MRRWAWSGGSPKAVRWRLTLLYATLFVVFGAVLLAISYGVVRAQFNGRSDVRFISRALPTEGPGPTAIAVTDQKRVADTLIAGLHARTEQNIDQILLWFGVALGVSTLAALVLGWLLAGRAIRPLEDAFDSQRNFIAHASHELRTPLAVMRTSLDVTDEEGGYEDPAQVRMMVATQRKALARSEALVNRLLALAMSDRGLDRRDLIDLSELVDDALEETAPAAAARRLTVRTDTVPSLVSGDPILLRQLVGNLVENATRHNRDGGLLEVSLDARGDAIALTVLNDGPRLDGDVGELLQPFRRGGARDGTGYGLGLSVVDRVARAHRATVALEARARGGLRAEVLFARAR
jgi:signal transduction histidine kinase